MKNPLRISSSLRFSWSNRRRGSVVLVIVMFMMVLALMPVMYQFMNTSNRRVQKQLDMMAQATNIARGGITEAIGWFRRRGWVAGPAPFHNAFNPIQTADPLTSETEAPTLGLVRSYPITESDKTWARFEVRKYNASNPNAIDVVRDISDRRIAGAVPGSGLAWYIESVGYVYRRRTTNPLVAFNQSPNEVIGRARVSTEIYRLAVNKPANAAVIINNENNVNIGTNVRIVGGSSFGIAYYTNPDSPAIEPIGAGSSVTSRVDVDPAPGFTTSDVFGVDESKLSSLSDLIIDKMSDIPTDYPDMSFVYAAIPSADGTLTFDGTRRLRGGGILYVKGNLIVQDTSDTFFSWLIFVTGNATLSGDGLISGMLLVQGTLTLSAAGSAVTEIDYDGTILDTVRDQLGQYRESKTSAYTFNMNQ